MDYGAAYGCGKKIFNKLIRHKFYTTIDELPMYNWLKVHETGHLRHIIMKRRLFGNGVLAWNSLYNEYLNRFGMSERMEEYLTLLREQINNYAKATLENDTYSHVMKQITEARINDIEKAPKVDFNEQNAALEKYMGIAIDLRRTSVSEYMGKVKLMQSDNGKN